MSTTNDSGWDINPLKNPKRKIEHVVPAPTATDYVKVAAKKAAAPPDPGIAKDSRMTGNPYSDDSGGKKKFGQALSSINTALTSDTAQKIYGGIGTAANIAGSFIDRDTTKNPTGFDSQQAIGNAMLRSGNPYLMAAGAAYNTLSVIAEKTNGNIHTINKNQADEVGLTKSERFFNNVFSAIPGLGWGKKETAEGEKSHLINEMSNAYADTVSDIDLADTLGGSKFLFGRDKIQDHILTANRNNQLLTEMNLTNTQRKKSDYAQDLAQQNLNRYAGTNYMNMRMGRKGMKIQNLEEIRELLKNRVIEELDVQKFAEGGSLMPAGKLHKELSHINELGEQYEDLTRKGIPVVTLDEGGEIQQVAEVERDEWIWNLEFTQQIEALWKDGSEEAMIEAGKLLTEELLRNTDDISGIIHKEEEKDGDD